VPQTTGNANVGAVTSCCTTSLCNSAQSYGHISLAKGSTLLAVLVVAKLVMDF